MLLVWIRQGAERMRRLRNDRRAQDMIEWALLASAIVLGAGAFLPPVGNSVAQIFSKVGSILVRA